MVVTVYIFTFTCFLVTIELPGMNKLKQGLEKETWTSFSLLISTGLISALGKVERLVLGIF